VYLEAAEKAFAYSSSRTREQVWVDHSTPDVQLFKPWEKKGKPDDWREQEWTAINVWAAAELLRTTGKAQYADYVKARPTVVSLPWMFLANGVRILFALANCDALAPDVRDEYRAALSKACEQPGLLPKMLESPYRVLVSGAGWGSAQAINNGPGLIRSIAWSQGQTFVDRLSGCADWHLGCNPLSRSFITGMGYRYPLRPTISLYQYEQPEQDLGGKTVRGLSIYGIGGGWQDVDGPWPGLRAWRDVWGDMAFICSEFTINQTLVPSAATYATLYALEKKAGRIPPGSKPDPLAR